MANAYDYVQGWDDPVLDDHKRELLHNPSSWVSRRLLDHVISVMVESDQKRRTQFR